MNFQPISCRKPLYIFVSNLTRFNSSIIDMCIYFSILELWTKLYSISFVSNVATFIYNASDQSEIMLFWVGFVQLFVDGDTLVGSVDI